MGRPTDISLIAAAAERSAFTIFDTRLRDGERSPSRRRGIVSSQDEQAIVVAETRLTADDTGEGMVDAACRATRSAAGRTEAVLDPFTGHGPTRSVRRTSRCV